MFNKKNFLEMENAELISKSIVLVDNVYKGKTPETDQQLEVKNPFEELSNTLFLRTIINDIEGFKVATSNKFNQEFIFGDIYFSNRLFPPKFIIKHNTNDKKIKKVDKITSKIIKLAKLNQNIGAIGVNYEFFIENEDNHLDLTKIVCKENISNAFNKLNITLVYEENNTILNLQITDGILKNKKVVYILANFHNEITDKNTSQKILKKDFLKTINNKINIIFSKNE